MMSILFYSTNPLRVKPLEAHFKSKGHAFYSADIFKENLFLIEDLKPKILIFDAEVIEQDDLKDLVLQSGILVYFLGENPEFQQLSHPQCKRVSLPFNPLQLAQTIEQDVGNQIA